MDTRRSFPLSRLETRLRCPMCGLRDVRLIFTVPREAQTVRGAKSGRSESFTAWGTGAQRTH